VPPACLESLPGLPNASIPSNCDNVSQPCITTPLAAYCRQMPQNCTTALANISGCINLPLANISLWRRCDEMVSHKDCIAPICPEHCGLAPAHCTSIPSDCKGNGKCNHIPSECTSGTARHCQSSHCSHDCVPCGINPFLPGCNLCQDCIPCGKIASDCHSYNDCTKCSKYSDCEPFSDCAHCGPECANYHHCTQFFLPCVEKGYGDCVPYSFCNDFKDKCQSYVDSCECNATRAYNVA
jgi:hypothetical protein